MQGHPRARWRLEVGLWNTPTDWERFTLQVQYFSFEGGVLERIMAGEFGNLPDRSAEQHLAEAAQGHHDPAAQHAQHSAAHMPPEQDRQLAKQQRSAQQGTPGDASQPRTHARGAAVVPSQAPAHPNVRSRHDTTLYGILTGGVLIIYVRTQLNDHMISHCSDASTS